MSRCKDCGEKYEGEHKCLLVYDFQVTGEITRVTYWGASDKGIMVEGDKLVKTRLDSRTRPAGPDR